MTRVTKELLEKGYIPQGYLGVGVYPAAIPESLKSKLSVSNDAGILILSVEKGGPADRAGVLLGDVLLSLGTAQMERIEDLQSFCASAPIGTIGKTVNARLIRAGSLIELSIVLAERPRKGS